MSPVTGWMGLCHLLNCVWQKYFFLSNFRLFLLNLQKFCIYVLSELSSAAMEHWHWAPSLFHTLTAKDKSSTKMSRYKQQTSKTSVVFCCLQCHLKCNKVFLWNCVSLGNMQYIFNFVILPNSWYFKSFIDILWCKNIQYSTSAVARLDKVNAPHSVIILKHRKRYDRACYVLWH